MRLEGVVVAAVLIAAVAVAAFTGGDGAGRSSSAISVVVGLSAICAAVIALQYVMARLNNLSRFGAKVNVQRLVQHVSSGVLIIFLFLLLPERISQLALGVAVGGFSLLQAARLASSEINTQFLVAFGPMLKQSERNGVRPPGAFYFLLGCLLSALLLPRRLAIFAMLSVTVGDPLAAVGGAAFGGPCLLGPKTLCGFLACCSAGACACLGVLVFLPPSEASAVSSAADAAASTISAMASSCLICALATGIGELVGGHWALIDDNLTASFGSGAFVMAVHLSGLLDIALC